MTTRASGYNLLFFSPRQVGSHAHRPRRTCGPSGPSALDGAAAPSGRSRALMPGTSTCVLAAEQRRSLLSPAALQWGAGSPFYPASCVTRKGSRATERPYRLLPSLAAAGADASLWPVAMGGARVGHAICGATTRLSHEPRPAAATPLPAPVPLYRRHARAGWHVPPGERSLRAPVQRTRGGRLPLFPRPGRRSSIFSLGFRGSATLSAGRRAIEEWLALILSWIGDHEPARCGGGASAPSAGRPSGYPFLARSSFNSD